MKRYLFIIVCIFFSLLAKCIDSYKVTIIDNSQVLGLSCNAMFINFSQGYKLYYPVLEAQNDLFDKIAKAAQNMAINYSEYKFYSDKKIVQGDINSLGILVYAIYKKSKIQDFKLPEFILEALPLEKYYSFKDIPEGGILITSNGIVFCNKNQFEWLKRQSL